MPLVAGQLLILAVLVLYAPARRLELAGDDFLLVRLARAALHEPRLLLASLDGFYRPTTTWTLAADLVLWGRDARRMHATNVVLHAAAAVLLLACGRRLGLPLLAAFLVALLWAVSPFASEPVLVVGARIDTLLFLGWLGLALLWPRGGEDWTPRRVAAAAAVTLWLLFSKETWVTTALVAVALERWQRGRPWGVALRLALPFAGLAVLYTAAYFLAFPGSKGYYAHDPRVLLKVPHMLAAFLLLELLVPFGFHATVRSAFALVAVFAAAAYGLKRGRPAAATGVAWIAASLLPTLFVPYLPLRYTAIPYAGFLLVIASCLLDLGQSLPRQARVAGGTLVALWVARATLVLPMLVRRELADAARVADAHRGLLAQAARFCPELPLDRPVLIVRAENDNPLLAIARRPLGLAKYYYVRHDEPLGLTQAAALFDWVLGRDDLFLEGVDADDPRFAGVAGAVVTYDASVGFALAAGEVPDLASEARRRLADGSRSRILVARHVPVVP